MALPVRALSITVAILIALAAFVILRSPPGATADCEFILGFEAIRGLAPDVVGDCRTNEYHNGENGDGLQETTGGLLVWRKADNWTAFTDGHRTWINGPNGLQQRLNTERFDWEADAAPTSTSDVSGLQTAQPPAGIGVWVGLNGTDPLRHVQGSGIKWAKVSLYWRQIEPTEGKYDFRRFDQLIGSAAAYDASVIVTIMGIPEWAAEKESGYVVRVAPEKRYAFQSFLKRLAQHSKDKSYNVKYWEIFNEPDNKDADYAEYVSSAYGYQPEKYADLLKASRDALTSVNPDARVAFGGVAMEDYRHFVPDFCERVFGYIASRGSDGSDYFDAMNIHAYAFYRQRWSSPEYGSQPGLLGKINYVKKLMRDAGLAEMPVLITETGMEVGDPKPDASQQAAYAVRVYVEASAAGSPAAIWFTISDNEGTGRGQVGLLDRNWRPRPSYEAVRYLAGRLDGARSIGMSPGMKVVSGRAAGIAFDRGGSTFHVLWGEWDGYTQEAGPTGGNATVRLPGARARLTDMLGNDAGAIEGAGGFVTIPLTYQPVYVEIVEPQ